MTWYFLFFFISGFCGILYEIVWLRLAMAQFGVTSALVSIVISMFMAGLGLGSWASGVVARRYAKDGGPFALRLYSLSELLIGFSALFVPVQLRWGRILLEHTGLPSSGTYYLGSALWVALTLVPWCACMGATIPFAMAAIKQSFRRESASSFSYLYLANVVGATAGAIVPLFVIELFGFFGTLRLGAGLNFTLAISAFALSMRNRAEQTDNPSEPAASAELVEARSPQSRRPLFLLFATGLTSMGLEVVWIRQFTPYLGTMVYAFATILALYLLSTLTGSKIYRIWSKHHDDEPELVWLGLGFCAFLSLAAGDPHFRIFTPLRPIIGIAPFSMILGFVTPMLVDRWSGGSPDRAGSAYATNVIGCILGPLLSGFLLLPFTSEHWVICIFAFPWLLFGMTPLLPTSPRKFSRKWVAYATVVLALQLAWVSQDYETQFHDRIVLRDSTATVVATTTPIGKQLFVNGIGMTSLTAITKMMAHLPMASLNHPAHNALTICFGMGTTFRSLLTWGIPTTAVELVPSVPRVFSYYHSDGDDLLRSPLGHLVIDDGRRYVERTSEQYDVIAIDPPPPIEAAGSSMLYSKEFYSVLNQRLRPDGILDQWLPEGDPVVRAAVARALSESFPYVRVIKYFPTWGYQFLASKQPIPERTAADLVARMPDAARRDMMEWPFAANPEMEMQYVLQREISITDLIGPEPDVEAMRDDHPVNEYVLLRKLKGSNYQPEALVAWYEHTLSRP